MQEGQKARCRLFLGHGNRISHSWVREMSGYAVCCVSYYIAVGCSLSSYRKTNRGKHIELIIDIDSVSAETLSYTP